MTRIALVTAGILLSATLATTCQAAVDCKSSPGSPGCTARAVKTIAPPKPEPAMNPASEPRPKPEPRIVPAKSAPKTVKPKPASQAAGQPTRTHRSARRAAHPPAHRRSLAQNPRSYRYDGQPKLASPRSRFQGPSYEAGRGQPPGYGCDEICRYRAWFRQYDDWYRAYGRHYGPDPRNAGAAPMPGDDPARYVYRDGERARLDPWHGYNPDDGPQNGY